MESLNQHLFLIINHFAGSNAVLDHLVYALAEYMPFLFAVVLLWLGFFNKAESLVLREERRQSAFFAGYTLVLGLLINFVITLFYFHPRPFMDHLGTELIPHLPDSSMPSDHTTLMVSVALGLLVNGATRQMGKILLVLGVIGGLSRVFCGVHYPFDIFGSIIVSGVAVVITTSVKTHLQKLTSAICAVLEKKVPFLNFK